MPPAPPHEPPSPPPIVCPCLTTYPGNITTESDGTLAVTVSGTVYAYPGSYGLATCDTHDASNPPYCDTMTGPQGSFNPLANPGWCSESWCYVDPAQCNVVTSFSSYLPGHVIQYSYAACSARNAFSSFYNAIQPRRPPAAPPTPPPAPPALPSPPHGPPMRPPLPPSLPPRSPPLSPPLPPPSLEPPTEARPSSPLADTTLNLTNVPASAYAATLLGMSNVLPDSSYAGPLVSTLSTTISHGAGQQTALIREVIRPTLCHVNSTSTCQVAHVGARRRQLALAATPPAARHRLQSSQPSSATTTTTKFTITKELVPADVLLEAAALPDVEGQLRAALSASRFGGATLDDVAVTSLTAQLSLSGNVSGNGTVLGGGLSAALAAATSALTQQLITETGLPASSVQVSVVSVASPLPAPPPPSPPPPDRLTDDEIGNQDLSSSTSGTANVAIIIVIVVVVCLLAVGSIVGYYKCRKRKKPRMSTVVLAVRPSQKGGESTTSTATTGPSHIVFATEHTVRTVDEMGESQHERETSGTSIGSPRTTGAQVGQRLSCGDLGCSLTRPMDFVLPNAPGSSGDLVEAHQVGSMVAAKHPKADPEPTSETRV